MMRWAIYFVLLRFASLIVCAEPSISHTFPPPDDVRKPDRTLSGGRGPVGVIAYSDNGRLLAAGCGDNAIRVWDARPGERPDAGMTQVLKGHTAAVVALAFSANSNELVSVSMDRSAKVWDVAGGKLRQTIPLGVKGKIRGAAFRPGKSILAVLAGKNVELWNYDNGRLIARFAPHNIGVASSLTFSPDGRIMATRSSSGTVVIRDAETLEPLIGVWTDESSGMTGQSTALATNVVAIGGSDGVVRLWKLKHGASMQTFRIDGKPVRALAFSPKGEQLAAASADNIVHVWDVDSGALLCSQKGHAGAVLSVAFSPNGQKMASSDDVGSVNYWTVPLPPLTEGDLEKIRAALPAKATATPKKPRRILVFWRADAILHKGGVPAANHAIEWMGQKTGAFETDFTRDYDAFRPDILARYDAIVMNSTAHLAMPEAAKAAYLDFVRRGGGVVGIHAAIDTFRDWPEGAAVIGATFGNHPWHPSGTWAVKLEEPDHPLLRAWGGREFKMHDEFYEMGDPFTRSDRRVLMSVDLSDPTTAGVSGLRRKDRDFALSWVKRYGQGRVFYCVFGHIVEPFQNPAVLQYYLDGIQYTLGDLVVDDSPRPAGH
jgi:WD40 repeat protein/type 1 glutamine amidotransferase